VVFFYFLFIIKQYEQKKLHKRNSNKVIGGVFGGLGEYFDIDPSLIRLFWVLLVVFTGFVPGIVAYLFALVIVPKKSV